MKLLTIDLTTNRMSMGNTNERAGVSGDSIFSHENGATQLIIKYPPHSYQNHRKYVDFEVSTGERYRVDLGLGAHTEVYNTVTFQMPNSIMVEGKLKINPLAMVLNEGSEDNIVAFKTFVFEVESTVNAMGNGAPRYSGDEFSQWKLEFIEIRDEVIGLRSETGRLRVEVHNLKDEVEGRFQSVIENTTGKDVISAPEIISARDGEANLKARLDKEKQEVTEQLTEKADKLNVRFREVKLDQNDMTDNFLQQITGNAPINATPNKGSITRDRLTQGVIGEGQTDFITRGKNLYDKDNLTAGYAINASGELFSSSIYYVTDFINILPNITYHSNNHNVILALYDSSFSFISRPLNITGGAFTTTENTAYARIAVFGGIRDRLQVEQGDVATEREDYSISMDKLKLTEKNFQDRIIETASLKSLEVGKNLFDIRKVTKGQLDMGTGITDSAIGGEVSDYIAIEPDTDYSKNKYANFAFYDENKSFIPVQFGTGTGEYTSPMRTFTSPENANYIRLGFSGGLSGVQLEKGVEVTDYQPFGYYISDLLYESEINELREYLKTISTGVVSKAVKYPTPAFIEPDISLIGGTSRNVAFVDKDDNLWAIQWDNKIYKNPVNTDTWELVIDVNPFIERKQSPLETISGYALQVSDTGRIVVATSRGRVLVSDEKQTTLSEAFTFKAGYTQNTWGYDKQGQYILMGSYGTKVASNPPREVYLSKDHGVTWELVFDTPISEMINAGDYHIHDVAFDPYSNMIIVVNGDTVNNQIHFSHDFGKMWQVVNPTGVSVIHPTSIVCFPEGIAFGSDDNPEGIYWWERPTDMADPIIKNEDIKGVKLFNIGEPTLGNIASKGDMLVDETGVYGVIGFLNHNTEVDGYPRLFATGDGGRSWHEIWKADNQIDENGFFNVLLRKESGKIMIYARYSIGGQPKMFRAEMPKFTEFLLRSRCKLCGS